MKWLNNIWIDSNGNKWIRYPPFFERLWLQEERQKIETLPHEHSDTLILPDWARKLHEQYCWTVEEI